MMKKALTMERPYTVLEKKLHELELRFTELFFPSTEYSKNPNPTSLNPVTRERISKEIQARVDFLKTLLLAEKECRSYGTHVLVQLGEIEERLEGLEMAFSAWTEGREISRKDCFSREALEEDDFSGKILQKDGFDSEIFDKEDGFNGESLEKDGFNGEISTCSCTRSCFSSEEEEEEGEQEEEDDVAKTESFELEIQKDLNTYEVQKGDKMKLEGKRLVRNRYCSRYFQFIGMVVTVLGAMVGIWMRFGDFEDKYLVLPPT